MPEEQPQKATELATEAKRVMAKLVAEHKTLKHQKGVAIQQIEAHLVDVKTEWDSKLSVVKDQIDTLKTTGAMPLRSPTSAAMPAQSAVQPKRPPDLTVDQIRARGNFAISPAANSHPRTKVPDMRIYPCPARTIDPFGPHEKPTKGSEQTTCQGEKPALPNLDEFGKTRRSNDHHKDSVKAARGR
jgi:hypothetical protein